MHTFSAALKKASREKPIELLALMVAALALLIAAVTAYFLWAQLRSLDKTLESQNDLLESQAYNYIDNGLAELDKLITDQTSCVLIQSPNFFGTIEDVAAIADIA